MYRRDFGDLEQECFPRRFLLGQIWNTRTGRCEVTLSGHADSVEKIIWGGEGLLYSASRDRTIKVGRDFISCAREATCTRTQIIWHMLLFPASMKEEVRELYSMDNHVEVLMIAVFGGIFISSDTPDRPALLFMHSQQ